MTLFLILLGTFIAIFERLMSAKLKPNFHFMIFLEKNWPVIFLNILTSLGFYFAAFYDNVLPSWKPFWNWELFNLVTIGTGALSLYLWKGLISTYKAVAKFRADKLIKK